MNSDDRTVNNAIDWAQAEYKEDSVYWIDRAQHGAGLIKKIAGFVLEAGT